jgi:hypothetical protein
VAEHLEVREAAVPVAPPPGEVPTLEGSEPLRAPTAVPSARAQKRIGRAAAGERWIVRILQGGALISGGMFLASLILEVLPQTQDVSISIDTLRKGAASLLLVTPVARLAVAGTMLGLRGEWRYALYAVGILGMLAFAVSSGLHA